MRKKLLAMVSSDEEDSGEVIPQTAPGTATLENFPEVAFPAEQQEVTNVSMLPSSGRECRMCSARLANLLSAAAALVAELDMEEPEEDAGVQELRPDSSATVGCRAREARELQPARAAAILPAGRRTTPTKLDLPQNSRGEVPSLKKQLPFMAAIFDPPSNVSQKFAMQRRGETEMPLAFHSALISLAQAAYPKIEQAGLDSLVLEHMLMLAQEWNVFLPTMKEDDLSSLKSTAPIKAVGPVGAGDGDMAWGHPGWVSRGAGELLSALCGGADVNGA
ncbi:unnamed protein product [Lampetra fluviatilis]